jgi:hypothetical protein
MCRVSRALRTSHRDQFTTDTAQLPVFSDGRDVVAEGEGGSNRPVQSPDGDTLLGPGDSVTFTTSEDFLHGTLFNLNVTEVPDELRLNPAGEIQTFPYIWIANSGEGTVSKFDTRTGEELGRYRTGPDSAATLLSPSRTAVTGEGDVWVANRAMVSNSYRQGSVVKILNSGFIDRNGNGAMDTSQDLNNDGRITGAELLPWDADGDGQPDDERIAMVINVGRHRTAPYGLRSEAGIPRAVALDADDNVWVGVFNFRQYEVYDGQTGQLLAIIPTDGTPYGAVIDANGQLWGANRGSYLDHIDTRTRTYVGRTPSHGGDNYGITIGPDGVVWTVTYNGNRLVRFDPQAPAGTQIRTYTASGNGRFRGVGVDLDGNVWTASNSPHSMVKFTFAEDSQTLLGTQRVTVGNTPSAAVVDSDGFIWTTTYGSNDNRAWKIDPDTVTVVPGWPIATGVEPYNYSDMTGAVRQLVTQQSGTWIEIIDSQQAGKPWGTVAIESQAADPSLVRLRVKADDERGFLDAIPWTEVQAGTLLSQFRGRYLAVEVTLRAREGEVRPSVQSITAAAIAPPTLSIITPRDESEYLAGQPLVVSGTATATTTVGPNDTPVPNRIAAVLVNGVGVEVLDAAGNFFTRSTFCPAKTCSM